MKREEKEELLRLIVLGELSLEDPDLRQQVEADPELARELDEMERSHSTIRRNLTVDPELLEAARGNVTPEDAALVMSSLRELATQSARPHRLRMPGWVWGIAASLLFTFVTWVVFKTGLTQDDPKDRWLGGGPHRAAAT